VTDNNSSRQLPVAGKLARPINLTMIVTILMGIISLGGLIFPEEFYQSDLLIQTFLTNDVINLVIGVPILLGSLWFTRRSNLTGLLIWPGALLFVIYNYLVYIIGLPLGGLTLVYLALVLLSVFNIYDILQQIDSSAVQDRLSGRVSEKLAGWFLLIFGILFILRALNMIIGTFLNHTGLPATEIGTLAADISISILWIIGGYFLLPAQQAARLYQWIGVAIRSQHALYRVDHFSYHPAFPNHCTIESGGYCGSVSHGDHPLHPLCTLSARHHKCQLSLQLPWA